MDRENINKTELIHIAYTKVSGRI